MLADNHQDPGFCGRAEELSSLLRRVDHSAKGAARSLVLWGPGGIGKTELLKQLFAQLFWRQTGIAPFHYCVSPALLSVSAFSRDYLARYICQRLAFESKDQALLFREGLSIDALSALAEERGALWAREIIGRYADSSREPLDGLRVAIGAPRHSTLATGMPAAVLIDAFHLLGGLHVNGSADPRTTSLFEAPMSFRNNIHIITGNSPEIDELPVCSAFDRIVLPPLHAEEASFKVRSLHRDEQSAGNTMPSLLLRHLGGNPFYITAVMNAVEDIAHPDEKDYWKAYAGEAVGGILSLRQSSMLKRFFPDSRLRQDALTLACKIYHAAEPLSCRQIEKACMLEDGHAQSIAHALHLAGIVQGEFGVFRAVEDGVMRDVIDSLYKRQVLGLPASELIRELMKKTIPKKDEKVRFEITLPMAKEAELVAAQSLEQIGKNLEIDPDTVGKLQIAVIEACINAMEHGSGADRNVYLSIAVDKDQMEVVVESSGQDFILQETGEPIPDKGMKTPGRGWGIKLMKRFVDEVSFKKTIRGTKTVLIKKIGNTVGIQKEKREDHD